MLQINLRVSFSPPDVVEVVGDYVYELGERALHHQTAAKGVDQIDQVVSPSDCHFLADPIPCSQILLHLQSSTSVYAELLKDLSKIVAIIFFRIE